MNIRDGYTLTNLQGHTYLLPYGQNISLHRPGMELNETSLLLWDAVCAGADEAQLLDVLSEHYQAEPHDLPILQEDITHFCEQLRILGLIDGTGIPGSGSDTDNDKTSPHSYYAIAELYLEFRISEDMIPPEFSDYQIAELPQDKKADLAIDVQFTTPAIRPVGNTLVRSDDFLVMENEERYILLFPASPDLIECHMAKDASHACFYCKNAKSDTYSYQLFHGIRFVYLFLARLHDKYMIHSASILYKGKAWLFSASSGTGKSTHTNLWKELYPDEVSLLNGDLNLLSIHHGAAAIYGIPWCGTSGITNKEVYPLGGIILLRQYYEDRIERLPDHKKQLLISQRLISPVWTRGMLEEQLQFIHRLLPEITCFRLWCTKEQSAALLCRTAIDEMSESKEITNVRSIEPS